MNSEPATLSLGSHLRFRILGDECVVVDQKTSVVAVVNKVGGRVLERLASGCCRSELITSIAGEYGLSDGEVQQDLVYFLSQIRAQGWLNEDC